MCGLLLIDPHGSLYDGIMQWLAGKQAGAPHRPHRPPLKDWVVSQNLLRKCETGDPEVLVNNLADTIARVWGQGGLVDAPRFARWVMNVLAHSTGGEEGIRTSALMEWNEANREQGRGNVLRFFVHCWQ